MRDPFAQKSTSSALRDAQIGLLLVATLLGVFAYVAYYRITGQGRILPEHVRMAPVATAVWPNGPPEPPIHENLSVGTPNTAPKTMAPQTMAATTVAATPQANLRPSTNPARKFELQHKPIQKPIAVTVPPKPLRTDRHVSPVDFQRAATNEEPKPAFYPMKTSTEMALDPGLKPIKMPTSSQTDLAANKVETVGVVNKIAKPEAPPIKLIPTPTPAPNTFQPKKTIFKQSSPKVEDLLTPGTHKKTIGNAFHPIAAAASNNLRPQRLQPRMQPPTCALCPKKVETESSFQPLANTFQPTTKQAKFSPQQDIAKLARVPTVSAPKPDSFANKTPAEPRPAVKKPAAQASTSPSKTPQPNRNLYVTRQGDGFWSIATDQYGDGRLFDALYRWNREKVTRFDDLPTATELEIPTKAELARRWPDLCPNDQTATQSTTITDQSVANYDTSLTERLYTTREGDTLFDIAAKKLGQASRYVDIMAKNDQRLPADVNHSVPLQAGLRLVLPD